MSIKRKVKRAYGLIRSRKGFSLAELLAATVILLLATSILTATVSLAVNRYQKSAQISASMELCSELSEYAMSELSSSKVAVVGGEIKKGDHGEILFNSDSHNFGPGAHFTVVNKDGDIIGYVNESDDGPYGRLCESSVLYSSPLFDIAGEGAYRLKTGKYELSAGMSIKYEDDAFKVHIKVVDKEGNVLSENYFLAVPIIVDKR
ncbi:prepilin-type N-terminal cleavage/methylation domain-containing protein [Butyrivibrio sp. XB500-5]|uniref:type II secretion system protein n=1 Tax=Butyrivibrio sp. XB500-5 TaxID=2364880 RepID=UPI000EA88CD4|nr:prepilin-type N-terminal cleavage/methylation domain-containing protein [Butyrivibrio sp. XB500-5]RKM58578.1 prepilin-type N-terminal cleavage/methylation domain-containing protein [Butyrivibrio sp. XB500-5]